MLTDDDYLNDVLNLLSEPQSLRLDSTSEKAAAAAAPAEALAAS